MAQEVQDAYEQDAILRRPKVKILSGLGRSTLYSRISEGLWTKPVALGPRAVGWPLREVQALNAARVAGRSDEQIRALVIKLEAARIAAGGAQ